MSDLDQQTITIPVSDPVHAVWIWRQDSITLARMRPVLEQLDDILRTAHCDREIVVSEACYEIESMPREQWCFTCRVRGVQLGLYLAANPTYKGAAR